MQIFARVFGNFPTKLVWIGCQGSQINIGSGYDVVSSGNKP